MEIKKLTEMDIKKALDLVWEVFSEFEAPEYSSEGINEFKDFIEYGSIIKMMNGKTLNFWGCYKGGDIVGVIATKGIGHICLLFVKKEYHRQGIARSLFETVRDSYEDKDVKEITVNSSPYAVQVYHRLGFREKDSEQVINGIRFTPMSYDMHKV